MKFGWYMQGESPAVEEEFLLAVESGVLKGGDGVLVGEASVRRASDYIDESEILGEDGLILSAHEIVDMLRDRSGVYVYKQICAPPMDRDADPLDAMNWVNENIWFYPPVECVGHPALPILLSGGEWFTLHGISTDAVASRRVPDAKIHYMPEPCPETGESGWVWHAKGGRHGCARTLKEAVEACCQVDCK